MAFIIRNPHDHIVMVGHTPINPKQQLRMDHETPDLSKALDKGDIVIVGNDENDASKDPKIDLDLS